MIFLPVQASGLFGFLLLWMTALFGTTHLLLTTCCFKKKKKKNEECKNRSKQQQRNKGKLHSRVRRMPTPFIQLPDDSKQAGEKTEKKPERNKAIMFENLPIDSNNKSNVILEEEPEEKTTKFPEDDRTQEPENDGDGDGSQEDEEYLDDDTICEVAGKKMPEMELIDEFYVFDRSRQERKEDSVIQEDSKIK